MDIKLSGPAVSGLVFTAFTFATTGVHAGKLDGSASLVCSSTHIVACTHDQICEQGQASTYELPDFFFLDFDKKQVRSAREGDDIKVSAIGHQVVNKGRLILQGVENGHGWSMTIDQETGRVATVATGEDLSFIVYGACTQL